MPSQPMQDVIDALRDRQKAAASQAPPTLEERRAAFTPGDRLHPVPDDVAVREVTAGGVPAHWLAAPGADDGQVLLFLHGGGFELCAEIIAEPLARNPPPSNRPYARSGKGIPHSAISHRRFGASRSKPHCKAMARDNHAGQMAYLPIAGTVCDGSVASD